MKARDLRGYGRARITSDAGDVVRSAIVRRTGAPSTRWKGEAWRPGLYATLFLPEGFVFALHLDQFGLAQIRAAARAPGTSQRTRRALNRLRRARRTQGER